MEKPRRRELFRMQQALNARIAMNSDAMTEGVRSHADSKHI